MKIFDFKWLKCLIFIFVASGIAACSPKIGQIRDIEVVQPPSVPRLKNIEVVDLPESTQILLEGDGVLQYTSFTLSDPPRLVIDLSDISLGEFKEPIIVNKGSVTEIYPIETDMPISVARLDIRLVNDSIESKIYRRDNTLIIDIPKSAGGVAQPMAEMGTPGLQEAIQPHVPEESSQKAEDEGQKVEAEVITQDTDSQEVETAADIADTATGATGAAAETVVQPLPAEEAEKEVVENSVPSSAGEAGLQETAVQPAPAEEAKKEVAADSVPSSRGESVQPGQKGLNVIKDIKIIPSQDRTNIIISADMDIDAKTFMVEDNRLVIDVKDATYSIKSYEIPVENSNAISRVRIGLHTTPVNKVRVVADLKGKINYDVNKEGKSLTVSVHAEANTKTNTKPPEIIASEAQPPSIKGLMPESVDKVPPKASEKNRTELHQDAGAAPSAPSKYTGKKVSLDFQDADIINVLRLLGEVSRLNMVIGDNVKGKITIKMLDVPWDHALDVVLKLKGLGKIYEDNVLRIDTLSSISQQQEDEAKAKEAIIKAEDLVTKILPINYARARDISESIKKVLSARGDITVDDRTNTLIIKDIKDKHEEIGGLVKTLDKPTPQVLIEARIVQADSNFARDLGIQWGGNSSSGIPSGDYNIGIVSGPGGSTIGSPTTGFAVNLPAAGVAGTKGSLGFTIAKAGDFNLDLRLSAGETKGLTKVLSAPKITTLDNREATIQQGESIPYKTISQTGTKTEFIDATLTLKVTPKVTPDGHIAMNIKISKNRQGSLVVEGTPSINKKEATTEVLVKDGETTVIGGIYETTDVDNLEAVPWFHKVPIFGWLFKRTQKSDIKTELLIFITPKIIPVTT